MPELPNSPDAEAALIAACFINPDVIHRVSDIVTADDFYSTANGRVFSAMSAIAADGGDVTWVTVGQKLASAGLEVPNLAAMTEATPTSLGVTQYADIVASNAMRRRAFAAGYELSKAAIDPTEPIEVSLAEASAKLDNVSSQKSFTGVMTAMDAWGGMVTAHEGRIAAYGAGNASGVPSGIAGLDNLAGGMHGGELIVIAGRPGHGKSILGMNIACHVALSSRSRAGNQAHFPAKTGGSLFFSLEMSAQSLLERACCALTRADIGMMATGRMPMQTYRDRFAESGLLDAPIYVQSCSGIRIGSIVSRTRATHARRGIDIVVVDYLQLVKPDSQAERRDLDIAQITSALKGLAMRLNIPVVLLAQLNREVEKRGNNRPMLSDLRESGNIEQDADRVLFIVRDELNEERHGVRSVERATLHVAKNRNGPVGKISLAFRGRNVCFEAMTPETEAEIKRDIEELQRVAAMEHFGRH